MSASIVKAQGKSGLQITFPLIVVKLFHSEKRVFHEEICSFWSRGIHGARHSKHPTFSHAQGLSQSGIHVPEDATGDTYNVTTEPYTATLLHGVPYDASVETTWGESPYPVIIEKTSLPFMIRVALLPERIYPEFFVPYASIVTYSDGTYEAVNGVLEVRPISTLIKRDEPVTTPTETVVPIVTETVTVTPEPAAPVTETVTTTVQSAPIEKDFSNQSSAGFMVAMIAAVLAAVGGAIAFLQGGILPF